MIFLVSKFRKCIKVWLFVNWMNHAVYSFMLPACNWDVLEELWFMLCDPWRPCFVSCYVKPRILSIVLSMPFCGILTSFILYFCMSMFYPFSMIIVDQDLLSKCFHVISLVLMDHVFLVKPVFLMFYLISLCLWAFDDFIF